MPEPSRRQPELSQSTPRWRRRKLLAGFGITWILALALAVLWPAPHIEEIRIYRDPRAATSAPLINSFEADIANPAALVFVGSPARGLTTGFYMQVVQIVDADFDTADGRSVLIAELDRLATRWPDIRHLSSALRTHAPTRQIMAVLTFDIRTFASVIGIGIPLYLVAALYAALASAFRSRPPTTLSGT